MKTDSALPNALAVIEAIGIDVAWKALAMKLHKRLERPKAERPRFSLAPHRLTFFNGLDGHFGKGTRVSLAYDFHERQFSAEIRGDDWRIRETEIVFQDLPATVYTALTGQSVSKVIDMKHLAGRQIASLNKRNTKRWKVRFQMDPPVPTEVGGSSNSGNRKEKS